MVVAVEPLVKAAEKHPDLAASVLETLARGKTMRAKAIPYLRKFCKHGKPAVRAAAVTALCAAAPDDVADELLAALCTRRARSALPRLPRCSSYWIIYANRPQTREQRIRRGSGDPFAEPSLGLGATLLSKVAGLFSGGPSPAKPAPTIEAPPAEKGKAGDKEKTPGEAKSAEEKPWHDVWLEECYAGKHRPKWTAQMTAPLEKMLKAGAGKQRVVAAWRFCRWGKPPPRCRSCATRRGRAPN